MITSLVLFVTVSLEWTFAYVARKRACVETPCWRVVVPRLRVDKRAGLKTSALAVGGEDGRGKVCCVTLSRYVSQNTFRSCRVDAVKPSAMSLLSALSGEGDAAPLHRPWNRCMSRGRLTPSYSAW